MKIAYKITGTIALLFLFCLDLSAQTSAARQDTILLSVHNNGQRFRMTPAAFGGASTWTSPLLKEMVVVYDTLVTKTRRATPDTSGRRPMMFVTTHVCGKLDRKVKGKVVLMEWDTLCDPSLIARNVQRDSGLALVLIHPRNHRDSIQIGRTNTQALPTQWVFSDSIRIPVYSVRREMGAKIGKMVPSLVGITRPDTMPADAQGLRTIVRNPLPVVSGKSGVGGGGVGDNTKFAAQLPSEVTTFEKLSIPVLQCTPNPADDQIHIDFSLPEVGEVAIEIRNATGAVVLSQSVKGVSLGNVDVDCSGWSSGVYFVYLRGGGSTGLATPPLGIGQKVVVVH